MKSTIPVTLALVLLSAATISFAAGDAPPAQETPRSGANPPIPPSSIDPGIQKQPETVPLPGSAVQPPTTDPGMVKDPEKAPPATKPNIPQKPKK